MKFWKTTLAVVVGVIIASVACTILSLMFIGAVASTGNSTPAIPSSGVLRIDMSAIQIVEQPQATNPMTLIQGGTEISQIGIWEAVQALRTAATDQAVKFIFIKTDGTSSGLAQLEEFRIALRSVSESGKSVIAYTENPGNADYYIASAADKIYMSSCEGGMNMIVGLSSRLIFLKDILDKFGVNVQLIRHGKFKSAGEMYIRNDISAENRLQYETLLGTIWNGWSEQIAQSRGITSRQFNALIDNLALNCPQDFIDCGLADALYTKEELEQQLCNLYLVDDIKKVKFIDFADYVAAKSVPNYRAKEKIAIIYADGEIKDGSDKAQVAGDRFASLIANVRKDKSVKAVVFRVNSPGGSVMASEKIRNEIELLRAEKPVIASYGEYAASGGYWISNSCDKIYSDASTLTGSIGVFSMIPEFSKTVKNFAHVDVVSINTNEHSDMYKMMRPLSARETAYMQASVESIYEKFTAIVAEGRDLDQDFVDSIAQGRVWAGADALEIGLVDEIGTLEDAVCHAAQIADSEIGSDLSNWQIVAYPKPLTIMEQLYDALGMAREESVLAGTPFAGIEDAFRGFNENNAGKVYARLPYAITIE